MVTVFLYQLADAGNIGVVQGRQSDCLGLDHAQDRVLPPGKGREKVQGLRDNGPHRKQRPGNATQSPHTFRVGLFRGIHQRYQRAGINEYGQ